MDDYGAWWWLWHSNLILRCPENLKNEYSIKNRRTADNPNLSCLNGK